MTRARKTKRGKYHEWITEEGCIKIEGYARDGLTNEQIAHNMGITSETLRVWSNKYPAISEALRKGKEVVDRYVENALYKRAIGYEYEEEKIYIQEIDGVITERKEVHKKIALPDTTAQIFWLKNRKPAEWRDRRATEHSGYIDTSKRAEEIEDYLDGV